MAGGAGAPGVVAVADARPAAANASARMPAVANGGDATSGGADADAGAGASAAAEIQQDGKDHGSQDKYVHNSRTFRISHAMHSTATHSHAQRHTDTHRHTQPHTTTPSHHVPEGGIRDKTSDRRKAGVAGAGVVVPAPAPDPAPPGAGALPGAGVDTSVGSGRAGGLYPGGIRPQASMVARVSGSDLQAAASRSRACAQSGRSKGCVREEGVGEAASLERRVSGEGRGRITLHTGTNRSQLAHRRQPQPTQHAHYITPHSNANPSAPATPATFSECDNVGARCPFGACTTHGSVVVTSTLLLLWLSTFCIPGSV